MTLAFLLQPLRILAHVQEDIVIDFIEGVARSKGKDSIVVIVDRLNKFAHFISLTRPFYAKTVAEKFIGNVVKLHSMPYTTISDRDLIFVSNFWQEFFKMSGSILTLSHIIHKQMTKLKL